MISKNNIKSLCSIFFLIIIFILFTIAMLRGFLKSSDLAIGNFLIKLGEGNLEKIFDIFRFLGHFNVSVFTLIGISIFAFKINLKKFAFLLVLIFIILTVTGYALKEYTDRQRPSKEFYEASYEKQGEIAFAKHSYPSGHVLRSTYLLLALSYLISKIRLHIRTQSLIKGILYFIIFLIGLSSIIIGVHWFSDVFGAFLLALVFYYSLISIAPSPT